MIPIGNLFYGAYEFVALLKGIKEKKDEEMNNLFKKYFTYIGSYVVLTFLMLVLYVLDFFYPQAEDEFLHNGTHWIRWFTYIVTLMSIGTPLIVGTLRLIQLHHSNQYLIKCWKKQQYQKTSVKKEDDFLNVGPLENVQNETLLTDYNPMTSTFERVQKKYISGFVSQIYISVCFCLSRSEKEYPIESLSEADITKVNCSQTKEHVLTKKLIQSEGGEIGSDVFVTKDFLNRAICIEFAPKIFSYLRKIDQIDTKSLIHSLLPSNNKNGIQESQGRSGNLFLNTDDKEYILKTISYEDLELIKANLLEKMAHHFSQNKGSIIGRIYGLFKIKNEGGDEIIFILMKNVFGHFNNNFICKYDLKGSILDRKAPVDQDNIETGVLKDVNFSEIEKVLLLSDEDKKRLLDNSIKDVRFLSSLEIMDYSLLVVKLTMNKDEISALFGVGHRFEAEANWHIVAGKSMLFEEESQDRPIDYKNLNFDINEESLAPLKKYIFPSLQPDIVYIISIIDFFQLYDFKKNFETKFKKLRSKTEDISSAPPDFYVNRFINFMKTITDTKALLRDINPPKEEK